MYVSCKNSSVRARDHGVFREEFSIRLSALARTYRRLKFRAQGRALGIRDEKKERKMPVAVHTRGITRTQRTR